jgi:pyridoxal phosphate enzyme (YggS family)
VTDRRTELADSLALLRGRIEAGCVAADRDPAGVTLIAVTKTFPASDVRLLADLGITDVGENRDSDASAKHAECGDLPLRWHMVGQVQRNKAKSVSRYADVVHSIDRDRLVTALGEAAVAVGRTVTALVQVNLDPTAVAGHGGAARAEIPELAAAIEASAGLRLGGLMAIAPLGEDPDPAFARLASLAAELQRAYPAAVMVSAGMSGDLEAALRHGATHLRVGTALLGDRPPVVG